MNEVNTSYMNPGDTSCPQYPYPPMPIPPVPIAPPAIIPVQVVQGPAGINGKDGIQGPKGEKGDPGQSGNGEFKIIVNPENNDSRLFGAVIDSIGGTYEMHLTNCRIIPEEDQLAEVYDDSLDGYPLPTVAISISSLSELVGGSMINEVTIYDYLPLIIRSLVGEDIHFPFVKLEPEGTYKFQSGTLITYCIEPIDPTQNCIIEFEEIQPNGRIFNFKRFESGERSINLSIIEQEVENGLE